MQKIVILVVSVLDVLVVNVSRVLVIAEAGMTFFKYKPKAMNKTLPIKHANRDAPAICGIFTSFISMPPPMIPMKNNRIPVKNDTSPILILTPIDRI